VIVKVYLDLILLTNFILDFVLLWSVGKFACLKIRPLRLCLAAIIGAVYSLSIFLPQLPVLLAFLVKQVCAFLMILTAFQIKSKRKLGQAFLYFYLLSFALGGVVWAAIYLNKGFLQAFNGIGVLEGVSYGWLVMGLICILGLGGGLACFFRQNWLRKQLLNQLIICFAEQWVEIAALLDTGNSLFDPHTRKPVIIIESQVINDVLPVDLSSDLTIEELFGELKARWASRVSLIPYHSVKAEGFMVGFQPDLVIVKNKWQEIITTEVVLGIVVRTLSLEGDFQALLHPQILC